MGETFSLGFPADPFRQGRLATFRIEKDSCWNNIWFADPAILGHYPEEGLKIYHDIMPAHSQADMDQICQPLDFIGTNIYTADLIAADNSKQKFKTLPFPPGFPVTAMDWPLVPESLYWGVRFLNERYQLPVVMTENGMAGQEKTILDFVPTKQGIPISDFAGKLHPPR